jgi:hypothetical protein
MDLCVLPPPVSADTSSIHGCLHLYAFLFSALSPITLAIQCFALPGVYSHKKLRRESLLLSNPHCKDTLPKIRNKYSQKRNCTATNFDFKIHVSVSDLYFRTIGLPIRLQENMWTDPGNI